MRFLKAGADKEQIKQLEKRWGKYNDFPEGWHEVTSGQDIDSVKRRLADCDWLSTQGRQMYPAGEGATRFRTRMVSANLFFTAANNGFAVGQVWESGDGWVWKYYKFGCQHLKYSGIKLGNCYFGYTCQGCGYEWKVDSGD